MLQDLQGAIVSFCSVLCSLLPPISVLLVVAGAITFAAGQLASAETRARATGWATAMIVGALFAFILVSLLPLVIKAFYGDSATCSIIEFI
ncbi:MAG: hypothetical protein QXV64_00120 [Candidatus Anstonellaceae archaeon]